MLSEEWIEWAERTRMQTAYHEAGHAVVAYQFRLLDSVTIAPDADMARQGYQGYTTFAPWPNLRGKRREALGQRRQEAELVICYAGEAASGLCPFLKRPRGYMPGCRLDFIQAEGLACGLCAYDAEQMRFLMGWAQMEAIRRVCAPSGQVAVRAIAIALLEQNTLDYAAVRAIIEPLKGQASA